jgi:hypothetical protein
MDLVMAPVDTSESGSPVIVRGAVTSVVVERAVFDSSLAYAIPVSQVRSALAHVSGAAVSAGRCVN